MANTINQVTEADPPVMSPEEGPLACVGVKLPPALQDYHLFNPEAMAIFRENLGGEALEMSDLIKIKVPAGGATVWTIPTIEGDEELVKEIQGIIIHVRNTRSYWVDEYSGSKGLPNCSSEDAIVGTGDPGGLCVTCPLSQWNSGPRGSNSQACKKVQLLFIMTPGNNLPSIIPVPRGSLKTVRKYLLGLANKNISYTNCVTSFKLVKADSKSGITYSQVSPILVTRVPSELIGQITAFVKENVVSFSKATLTREEMGSDS